MVNIVAKSLQSIREMNEHSVYVVQQQDRLLSCQLRPTFPPGWTECG